MVAARGQIYQHLPEGFKGIAKQSIIGIPLIFILSIIIGLILAFIINRTSFGRKLLATGANRKSADFSGIKTSGTITMAHTISGIIAGFAGIFMASRMGSAQTSIGSDWLIVSFAAPVLGGTLLSGGRVSVVGAFFGAILMGIIRNGLFLINVDYTWFFDLFIGLVLLAAFEFDRIRDRIIFKTKK